jgi:hypothetical protein
MGNDRIKKTWYYLYERGKGREKLMDSAYFGSWGNE